jgi:ankyrin repeat protein
MQMIGGGKQMLVLLAVLWLQLPACDGTSPLTRAIRAKDIARVERTLKDGIDANKRLDRRQRTPLMLAALEGTPEIVGVLIRYGADVNSTDEHGRSPLHYAARAGDCGSIQVLVANGAPINPPSRPFHTALMEAAGAGKASSTSCLVELGADLEVPDGGDSTALFHAVWSADIETVRALLESGADRTKRNRQGQTPLEIATRLSNREEIVRALETR